MRTDNHDRYDQLTRAQYVQSLGDDAEVFGEADDDDKMPRGFAVAMFISLGVGVVMLLGSLYAGLQLLEQVAEALL